MTMFSRFGGCVLVSLASLSMGCAAGDDTASNRSDRVPTVEDDVIETKIRQGDTCSNIGEWSGGFLCMQIPGKPAGKGVWVDWT